ncbi:c-type cytochrome [Algoriphagus sp. D3-2-R+10]|uniref:c-type cytochrome n=1 Tax=Algoriphagus aurantiacus TaxID=3103948 RepID=UPI002B36DA00|nr:c-type cytochrome [Algoriphagus sp. D3-2-R+10]MEB2774230.1 c-type cytochrome [Algoriphagus sp. D3-2-R+10]
MKITILSKSATIVLAVLLFACGGGEKAENSADEETIMATTPADIAPPVVSEPTQDTVGATEEIEEAVESSTSNTISGKDKVGNSDCLSCHYVDRQVIGPSFLDIAAEYSNNEENVAMLADKVIKGGTGVWGEVPMPPHATLSEEDAKDMVRYILGLN